MTRASTIFIKTNRTQDGGVRNQVRNQVSRDFLTPDS
jgi:hypothetical protein